jgi:hypothetical protein
MSSHTLYHNGYESHEKLIVSSNYLEIITEEAKQQVIRDHIDNLEKRKKLKKTYADYNKYIASYEYKRSLEMDNISEEIEAYTNANGSYYELILFHLHDFIESFNYTRYIYLRFYNNIRNDAYYSFEDEDGYNNLLTALENKDYKANFNNSYKSRETLEIFAEIITMRIKESFVIYNYCNNKIKHPYIYKSNIYNYLAKDFLYDYTSILDKTILLSPCEHDNRFLNIAAPAYTIKDNIADTDTDIAICITRNIYSIDFETFIDLSFVVKYYAKYFSKDGVKTLHTFYSNKMASLTIPELYKVFLRNIKSSSKIYKLYEKIKYQFTVDIKEELNSLNKELRPNMSGLIFIFKCNYVYRLWRMIFNTTNHYYLYYPEKRCITIMTQNIIENIENIKNDDDALII